MVMTLDSFTQLIYNCGINFAKILTTPAHLNNSSTTMTSHSFALYLTLLYINSILIINYLETRTKARIDSRCEIKTIISNIGSTGDKLPDNSSDSYLGRKH